MNNETVLIGALQNKAINLLKDLIKTPSLSKQENNTAEVLYHFLQTHGVKANRVENNIWATNKYFNPLKPTILLNSHHDTVPPNKNYTLNPYEAVVVDDKLFGLGSNDAGGCLVSLLATFLFFYEQENMAYNLLFAASAEEEISGKNGIELLLPHLGKIEFGIVGEPTKMQMAIAEKGLLVVDCIVKGKAGHAARQEGENAIYKALQDINWFKQYEFEKVSPLLGKVLMNVTIINAGMAHNMVPEICNFTVDIRLNELYTHQEILDIVRQHTNAEIEARSTRIKSSSIGINHPLVQSGLKLGFNYFGSPTTSDKALMNFPTVKIGPGDSARSHSADEFIYLSEIQSGIELYIKLLQNIL
jgi:acetylornithine deacetylase